MVPCLSSLISVDTCACSTVLLGLLFSQHVYWDPKQYVREIAFGHYHFPALAKHRQCRFLFERRV